MAWGYHYSLSGRPAIRYIPRLTPMALEHITLHDFRCFSRLEFHPGQGANFLIGPNAAGKTSILEAACVLLRLQSPRSATLQEAVNHGRETFLLDGRVEGSHLQVRAGAGGRHLEIDSVVQGRSEAYLRIGRVAWFGNDDLELIRGPSSKRRRYLDFVGAQSDGRYLKSLRAYERALRSRNALLKERRPRREVAAFDGPLAAAAAVLWEVRGALAGNLAPRVAAAAAEISAHDEGAAIVFAPGGSGDLLAALAASRDEEERLRQTVVGPHRDDLSITLDGREASKYASEGQQRTLALALKLAQTRLLSERPGPPPVLLIDDVFGELDRARRNRLMFALPAGGQLIVTSTTTDWLEGTREGETFHLGKDGILSRGL